MIEFRFGLNGEQPRTPEEVGRAFGVTRERIRQIENNMLKKLESLPEAQGLKDCVQGADFGVGCSRSLVRVSGGHERDLDRFRGVAIEWRDAREQGEKRMARHVTRPDSMNAVIR